MTDDPDASMALILNDPDATPEDVKGAAEERRRGRPVFTMAGVGDLPNPAVYLIAERMKTRAIAGQPPPQQGNSHVFVSRTRPRPRVVGLVEGQRGKGRPA